MISLIIVFLICCFACTGKRDVLVKDNFNLDLETGNFYPGVACEDCEASDFCTGYVNEKYGLGMKNMVYVCESGYVKECCGCEFEDICAGVKKARTWDCLDLICDCCKIVE